MKRFRLSLGIIATTIIGSLALITGPAYAATYWAPGSSPLHVNENGVLHGRAIRIHAEMSTIGRTTVQRIAEGLAQRGLAMTCQVMAALQPTAA